MEAQGEACHGGRFLRIPYSYVGAAVVMKPRLPESPRRENDGKMTEV